MLAGCVVAGAARALAIQRELVPLHGKAWWDHAIKNIAAFMDVVYLFTAVAHKMVMMVGRAFKTRGLVGQMHGGDQPFFDQGVEIAVNGGQVEMGDNRLRRLQDFLW
jgi:hypothetical protein